MLEWHKLSFRQRDDNLSHMYAMFTVDWNREIDQPTGIVSYEGVVSLEKLNNHTEKTHVLKKGDLLPGTNTPLQADNYGIMFKDLYKCLDHTVEHIVSHKPSRSLTENYINPYTGKTTAQIRAENSFKEQARIEATPTVSSKIEPLSNANIPQRKGVWERIKRWFMKR